MKKTHQVQAETAAAETTETTDAMGQSEALPVEALATDDTAVQSEAVSVEASVTDDATAAESTPTDAAHAVTAPVTAPAVEAQAAPATFGRVRGSSESDVTAPSARKTVMAILSAAPGREYRVADLHAICNGAYTKANLSSALLLASRAGLVTKVRSAGAAWWAIRTAE